MGLFTIRFTHCSIECDKCSDGEIVNTGDMGTRTVEDFGCSGDVDVIFATYRLYYGSNPYKEAEKMIDEIKRKEKYTTKTETYYVD